MTSETLLLDDLPHLAEDVRKAGYRSAMSEKEGSIRLEDSHDSNTPQEREAITSWQLVKTVWRGRAYVVYTSMFYPDE
jgi:hypothetical protein